MTRDYKYWFWDNRIIFKIIIDDLYYDLNNKSEVWKKLFDSDAKKNLLIYEPFYTNIDKLKDPDELYNYLLSFKDQFWTVWESLKTHICFKINKDSPTITKTDASIITEWAISVGLKKINKKKHRRKGNRTESAREIKLTESKNRW